MEAAPPATVIGHGPPRGGYRGRGSGGPMRGGFERGRGRGIGRGYYASSGMGRGHSGMGLPAGALSNRGMRPQRGGPGGYQARSGFISRGSNGPSMRGSRPPLYAQPPKQHTGSENNKTISPVPSSGVAATTSVTDSSVQPDTANGSNSAAAVTGGVVTNVPHSVVHSNGTAGGNPPPNRGYPRVRGGPLLRGGRGGYNYSNGAHRGMLGGHGGDHGTVSVRRGGPPRARGGYGQTMSRLPLQHSANTQIAPAPSLKRGAPGGAPGPKRGRYDHGSYLQRPMAPKYHQVPQHLQQMPSHQGYGAPQHHPQASSHHAYASHDQSHSVDPYAQSYAAPVGQTSYNGYGQGTYGTVASTQSSSGYAQHSTEYDQSQYQGYNSSSYATQGDTRYSTYGQDYTQQYGAPAVDYNSTTQVDYSQQGQAYDERAYAAYDTQSYQQNYSNAAGYY